ncbi:MAG: response regulator transcription factor [Candidatus Promineifilaceae bacterium]|nr:response regulator transcription factor [Candidatus Promineifilaceae bacterium]
MSYQILVVEDDTTLLEMLQYNLERQGYEVQVAQDGRSGLKKAREQQPDLILLDVMLPLMDGFEVCRLLRKESNSPVLMLTARTEEIDKIVGLEMGADDYVTKPFSMRELMARVKAHLRRVEMIREDVTAEQNGNGQPEAAGQTVLAFDNLVIDEDRREVFVDNEAIKLKPMEFELLLFLARNKGIALSRSLILERVWGWTFDGNSRTVDVHVRWLRTKIERDSNNPVRIVTVHGIGYRFDG